MSIYIPSCVKKNFINNELLNNKFLYEPRANGHKINACMYSYVYGSRKT